MMKLYHYFINVTLTFNSKIMHRLRAAEGGLRGSPPQITLLMLPDLGLYSSLRDNLLNLAQSMLIIDIKTRIWRAPHYRWEPRWIYLIW
jgi:hypothetical protein